MENGLGITVAIHMQDGIVGQPRFERTIGLREPKEELALFVVLLGRPTRGAPPLGHFGRHVEHDGEIRAQGMLVERTHPRQGVSYPARTCVALIEEARSVVAIRENHGTASERGDDLLLHVRKPVRREQERHRIGRRGRIAREQGPNKLPNGSVARFARLVNLKPLAPQRVRKAPDLSCRSRSIDPLQHDKSPAHAPLLFQSVAFVKHGNDGSLDPPPIHRPLGASPPLALIFPESASHRSCCAGLFPGMRRAWKWDMRLVLRLVLAAIVLLLPLVGCSGDTSSSEDEVFASIPLWTDTHDQGIYWFGPNNRAQKYRRGEPMRFFDPNKPTLLYVHGWQRGAICPDDPSRPKPWRETFNYLRNDPDAGVDVDLADAWIARGYNVGIFYWDRFADDAADSFIPDPRPVEEKIWQADGTLGMRWKKDDCTYETVDVPSVNAGELFANAYFQAMQGATRGVHIAGHSLGAQMAVRLLSIVRERVRAGRAPRYLMPTRLTLMDPYWSRNRDPQGNPQGVGARVLETIRMLDWEGTAIEQLDSSAIDRIPVVGGDSDLPTYDHAAYTVMRPRYTGFFDVSSSHRAAMSLYLWSIDTPPANCAEGAASVPSARSTTSQIREFRRRGSYWQQRGGRSTAEVEDDCYEEVVRGTPPAVAASTAWTYTAGDGRTTASVRVKLPPRVANVAFSLEGRRLLKTVSRRPDPDAPIVRFLGTGAVDISVPADDARLGQRLTVELLDARGRLLGSSDNLIDLGRGTADARAAFIRETGEKGERTFEFGFEPSTALLEVFVDDEAIRDERSGALRSRGTVQSTFERKDAYRSILLLGYDERGNLMARERREFVLQ